MNLLAENDDGATGMKNGRNDETPEDDETPRMTKRRAEGCNIAPIAMTCKWRKGAVLGQFAHSPDWHGNRRAPDNNPRMRAVFRVTYP